MADDPPLPAYPDNTAAFGRIMERLISKGSDIGIALRLANEGLAPEISDLQTITDDELYLVSRVAYATRTVNDPAVKTASTLRLDAEASGRSRRAPPPWSRSSRSRQRRQAVC